MYIFLIFRRSFRNVAVNLIRKFSLCAIEMPFTDALFTIYEKKLWIIQRPSLYHPPIVSPFFQHVGRYIIDTWICMQSFLSFYLCIGNCGFVIDSSVWKFARRYCIVDEDKDNSWVVKTNTFRFIMNQIEIV